MQNWLSFVIKFYLILILDDLTKLNLFDTNSLFMSSSADALQNSLLLRNKLANEVLSRQNNNIATQHLPDLLNGKFPVFPTYLGLVAE